MPINPGLYSIPGIGQTLYGLNSLGAFGGDGSDKGYLANYLRSLGIDIPRGLNARAFGKGQVLSQLLQLIGQPTGLESFYGPEFQQRAIGTTVARSAQPFAEAGRSLTSGFLRSGTTTPGGLTQARQQLAQGQAQTTGGSIQDLLLQLEGQRAGNVEAMEGIRQNRLSMLANFLNRVMAGHSEQKARRSQEEAATGSAIGGGVGGLLSLLALLCVVAEELFGAEDERTTLARLYMTTLAPPWLREGYREHGPEIVEAVKADFTLREALVPLFTWFGERAKVALAGGI